MTKPSFVGELQFTSHAKALDFCTAAGLSPTLIHTSPLRLKREWQLKVDQELASDRYWSCGREDD